MFMFHINSRRQRSKSNGTWPQWLRGPCLLRGIIVVGIWIFRLWRIFQVLLRMFGG